MHRYEDPNDPWNGSAYKTGKKCIEPGCSESAGTAWSPHWCQRHNAERMSRISVSLRLILEDLEKRKK